MRKQPLSILKCRQMQLHSVIGVITGQKIENAVLDALELFTEWHRINLYRESHT